MKTFYSEKNTTQQTETSNTLIRKSTKLSNY